MAFLHGFKNHHGGYGISGHWWDLQAVQSASHSLDLSAGHRRIVSAWVTNESVGRCEKAGKRGGERWPVFVYVTPTVSYLPSYTLAYKPLSPFNIPSFVQSVPDATPSCDCGQAVFIFLVLGRPPQRCCPEAAHGWRCRASGGRQATTPQPRFGDGVRAVLESVLSDSCYWFDRYPPPSSQSKTTGVDESSHGTIITFSELREEKVEWNFGSEVGSDYNPDDDFVEISYTDSDAVSSSAN